MDDRYVEEKQNEVRVSRETPAVTVSSRQYTLRKLSRLSARGSLAHVPYSSEDFIRDKRAEVELEDH